MNGQSFLFDMPTERQAPGADRALAHRHDPATSHIAAKEFRTSGGHAVHRQIVLEGVQRCPGGTHSEIAAVTPLDWLQVARRLSELERDALIRKGEARTCTVKGSKCVTWWPVETDPSGTPGASEGPSAAPESPNTNQDRAR